MIIFPAVDIKDGKCVRLKQGLAHEVTVFGDDPVAMAEHFAALGAEFLHVVDLDGAFSGEPVNLKLIEKLTKALDIPVQLGGGIRTADTAKAYLNSGIHRIIIGTVALENPNLFAELCTLFPEKIGVSLDAARSVLKTRGWVRETHVTVFDVLPRLEEQGAAFLVYTDITRDGMQTGVNKQALEELCKAASLPVIAAGGVATLNDIQNLYPLSALGLEGAISGRAIYDGTLDLKEATTWIASQKE